MKLKDFIKTFSHNNEIWVENKNRIGMEYRPCSYLGYTYDIIMDWELEKTDIAECEVIKIANVHGHTTQGITIVIDTEREKFNYLPQYLYKDEHPVCGSTN